MPNIGAPGLLILVVIIGIPVLIPRPTVETPGRRPGEHQPVVLGAIRNRAFGLQNGCRTGGLAEGRAGEIPANEW